MHGSDSFQIFVRLRPKNISADQQKSLCTLGSCSQPGRAPPLAALQKQNDYSLIRGIIKKTTKKALKKLHK